MIGGGKYNKFLTVLLVIAIIAIIGLLGFLGYDIFKKVTKDQDASEVVKQFEYSLNNEDENNTVNENTDANNPFSNMQNVNLSSGGGNVVKYEDYIVLGTIKISKTNIEYPILDQLSRRSLELAVVLTYGPGLNEVGNSVIIGHNYRNGLYFSNNKKLENGDKISIKDAKGRTIVYTVYNKYETDADDTTYMQRDTEGKREISLSTCTDSGNKRLIIWAKE